MLLRGIPSSRQLRALDTRYNVWLSANAGTGKTQVLTGRILRLLLEGVAPERILSLTFTNAAAAEMSDRIRREIAGWARLDDAALAKNIAPLLEREADGETVARARALFAALVDRPGQLPILTLHGFCQQLLASFPLEAGLAPGFSVMEDREAEECRRMAFETLLGADDLPPSVEEGIAFLACAVGDKGMEELLGAVHHDRTRLAALDTAATLNRLREVLSVSPEDTEEAVIAVMAGEITDRALLGKVGALLAGEETADKNKKKVGRALSGWLVANDADIQAYLGCFFTDDGEGGPRSITHLFIKKQREVYPDLIAAYEREQARLIPLREKLRAIRAYKRMQALLPVANAFMAEYAKAKSAAGKLDFTDLIEQALALLENPEIAPWIRYRLDGGVEHLLVDEAQDTSPSQWKIVAAICEEFFAGKGAVEKERTLFVVGDPKQSIYRFQGADPRVFDAVRGLLAEKAEAAGKPWRPEQLDLSYRSAASVLRVVDAVMDEDGMRALLGAEAATPHLLHREGDAGCVELWPVVEAQKRKEDKDEEYTWKLPTDFIQKDDPQRRVVEAVTGTIRRWLDEGRMLEAKGRPVEPGDILILVQRRGKLMARIVHSLKRHGIDVAGVDRLKLLDHIIVQDLVVLGRFVLLPEDDLSLAIILKSPFIGLDDAALFELAHERGVQSLWQRVRELRPDVAERLSALLTIADYKTPFDFYSDVLEVYGGRRQAASRIGEGVQDILDAFLNECLRYQRAHPPSLTGFLDWLEAEGADIKRNPELSGNQVRVMTVHGAKGLQAPIVFLPDAASPTGGGGRQHLLWDEETGLPLWPHGASPEWGERVKEEEQKAEDAEDARLLYVALTRAADELYVAGWKGERGSKKDQKWHECVKAALEKNGASQAPAPIELGASVKALRIENPQTKALSVETKTLAPELPPLPEALRRKPVPETVRKPVAVTSLAAESAEHFDAGAQSQEQAALRGTLLHRLLELLPRVATDGRYSAALRYLQSHATEITEPERGEMAAEAIALLSDAALADYFDPVKTRAEVAITGDLDGVRLIGRIDLLYVGEKEVVVIDFKTSRTAPESIDAIAPIYRRQMAAYAAMLATVFPKKNIRTALLYTRTRKLIWLS